MLVSSAANFAAEWLAAQTDTMKEKAIKGQFPKPGHRPIEGRFQQKHGENIALWGGSPGRVTYLVSKGAKPGVTDKKEK